MHGRSSTSQVPGAVFATVGGEVLKRGFALWADRSAGIDTLPVRIVPPTGR